MRTELEIKFRDCNATQCSFFDRHCQKPAHIPDDAICFKNMIARKSNGNGKRKNRKRTGREQVTKR